VDRFVFVATPELSGDVSDLDSERSKYGQIEFRVTYAEGSSPQLLMYYDGFDGWSSIYDSTLSCQERVALAPTGADLTEISTIVKDVSVADPPWTGRGARVAEGFMYVPSASGRRFDEAANVIGELEPDKCSL
jgi:hypothetical protein